MGTDFKCLKEDLVIKIFQNSTNERKINKVITSVL